MFPRKKYIEISPAQFTDLPDYFKCANCGYMAPKDEVVEGFGTCPRCGTYIRLGPTRRVTLIMDKDSFTEWDAEVLGIDPLEFPEYQDKLAKLREERPSDEAVLCGAGTIGGQPVAVAFMDPRFMMASMGSGVGERLSRLFDRATEEKLPVVVFAASGGARMQEGLVSLMQMAKVSCAVQRHDEAGLFYLSVLTDPTTGGVTASFAMQGDVIISEPEALIGFAGRRVVEGTVGESLPDDFQTAEFALKHGLIDGIVAREDLRDVISEMIALHARDEEEDVDAIVSGVGRREGRRTSDFLRKSSERSEDKQRGRRRERRQKKTADEKYAPAQTPQVMDKNLERRIARQAAAHDDENTRAWDIVTLARRTDRPTAHLYLEALVDGFLQMHGDRCYADDAAIVAGLGFIDGAPVTVITQEKGTNTAERVEHNFGCAHPEGYRKVVRLARQAEKFGRPVVCLVDTQGAHCDAASEERGQGTAIAECLETFAGLKTPVVSVILSEGGSGGALAMALGDRVAMMQNAIYSILSPEGFASILWKDASRAVEAAGAMRPTADAALEFGIIDTIIPEEGEGAHEHPDEAAAAVADYVKTQLAELRDIPVDELLKQRQERYARIGIAAEADTDTD